MESKPTILITGHAGTVGPPIVGLFMSRGFRVIGVDCHVPDPSKVALSDLAALECAAPEDFVQIKMSAQELDLETLIMCLPKAAWLDDMRYILHMGSPASPVHYMANPEFTFESNVNGTRRMIELAKLFNSRMVFTSTSEVYGTLEKDEFNELDVGRVNSYGNRSCYDVSKMGGEAICRTANEEGVDTGIVRIFNTYSEYGSPHDGRVINSFVYNLMHRMGIEIFGTGNQTRSFMHADDLADGIFRYVTSEINEPVNLGNPNTKMDINLLASEIFDLLYPEAIHDHMGHQLCDYTEHVNMDKDDPTMRKPDISRAKEWLNWEPKIGLHEGLMRIIEAYREHYTDGVREE